MSSEVKPATSNRIMRPWIGHALVEIIRTAERVGMIDGLEEPATATQLAQRLQLPERAMGLMLSVLCGVGYLERVGETYRRPADPEGMRESWPQLEHFVRTGSVPDHIDEPDRRGAYYAKSVNGLAVMSENDAHQLAEHLRPADRIADVGAGSAVWSLAMAARHHPTRIIAIDRPEVLPSTITFAKVMGLTDHLIPHEGDYFDAVLDEPVDRIVMANVLHLEDEAGAAELIRRYSEMLTDDGELVIIDMLGGDSYEKQLFASAYDLHLGMRTTKGCAHHVDKLRAWCANAGLVAQEVIELGHHGMAALVCGKNTPEFRPRETITVAVDELRALQADRDAQSARFQMVFDGAGDAIVVVDKSGDTLLRSNSLFCKLLDVDWTASETHTFEEVIAPGDVQRFKRLIQGLAAGRITERRHHIDMIRNGVPFSAELTVYDPLARSVILLVVRDRDSMARQEKMQALGELVAGLTHDINTPLGILQANHSLTQTLVDRVATASEVDARHIDALDKVAADAQRALDDIRAKLESIKAFANLEGPALEALAPHFKSGLARAICERAAVLGRETIS